MDLGYAFGVVVSPNQAPVASFLVASAQAVAGSPTQFDARGATDSDGSIVRYDWDFGDGTLLPNGGPTPQHVYTRPGTYVARLVVTDNEGASTGTVFTGGTVLGAGGPGAQTSRDVVVAAAASAPPGTACAPGPAHTGAWRPTWASRCWPSRCGARCFVRLPGARSFQPLENLEEIPLGATIDTRRGRVELTTVRDRRRTRLQEGVFYGGLFKVRQRRRDRYVTELLLQGRLSCPSASASQGSRRGPRARGAGGCGATAGAASAPAAATPPPRCGARSGWWRTAATRRSPASVAAGWRCGTSRATAPWWSGEASATWLASGPSREGSAITPAEGGRPARGGFPPEEKKLPSWAAGVEVASGFADLTTYCRI